MTSVPMGRCGPCCSVAASGKTAIHRAEASPAKSGQWMSVQSRGGTVEVIERKVSLQRFLETFPWTDGKVVVLDAIGAPSWARMIDGVQYEPGPFAASVNGRPGRPCNHPRDVHPRDVDIAGAGPDRAGQGL